MMSRTTTVLVWALYALTLCLAGAAIGLALYHQFGA